MSVRSANQGKPFFLYLKTPALMEEIVEVGIIFRDHADGVVGKDISAMIRHCF